MLVIVTSTHDVARRQAAAVTAAGAEYHQPTAEELIDDTAWARWSGNVLRGSDELRSTLLLASPDVRGASALAYLIPKRFAELAARMVESCSICGVVVTGGDGARALVDTLDASAIDLRGEVISGVPIGTLVGGAAGGLPIVTKAGGFGNEDTLVQAVEAVRYMSHEDV